jgi:hypothetical protein
MSNEYTLTKEDIKTAWESSDRRYGYPPIKESITITTETHPSWSREDGTMQPFVRMTAIPARLHEAVNELSIASTCPYIDEARNVFYVHDVYRWLRAVGVEADFVAPVI